MKHKTEFIASWKFFFILLALWVFFTGMAIYSGYQLAELIGNIGLKGLVEQVWNGKQGG